MKKIILLTLIFSSASFGAHNRCGIGSLVLGKAKGILSQVGELALNYTFSGGSSIMSGTSGCKHNGKFVINESEVLFIAANMEEMINDMATGNGEVIQTYAELIGCSINEQSNLKERLKSSIQFIVPQKNVDMDEFIFNLRNEIQLDAHLKTCHTIRVS